MHRSPFRHRPGAGGRSWLRLRAARPPEQRLWMLLRMLRYAARNGGKPCGGSPRAGSRGARMLRKHGAAARRRARAGRLRLRVQPLGFRFLFLRRRPAGRYPLVALPSLPLLLKRRKSNSPGARPPLRAPGLFSMCRHKRATANRRVRRFAVIPGWSGRSNNWQACRSKRPQRLPCIERPTERSHIVFRRSGYAGAWRGCADPAESVWPAAFVLLGTRGCFSRYF